MKRLTKILILLLCLGITGCEKRLPLPEISEGIRGEELGIDKNINEATIDEYLGREDAIYRDMRMLKDEADYEAIGGDSYLSGYVEGFEVVPYPYLCNVVGLPEEVGESYSGTTLFTLKDDSYSANYEESLEVLEYLFPKDKVIFLMCGGGGYAGMTKKLLVALGWDENKIYNTGGYWYYEGDHKVEIKRSEEGKDYYDFYKVPYHNIDFDSYHLIGGTDDPHNDDPRSDDPLIKIENIEELNKLIEGKNKLALYVYLPGCTSCAAFSPVLKSCVEDNDLEVYKISYSECKDSENIVTMNILLTPSVLLIENGEVKAYLDAEKKDDLPYYKDADLLKEWLDEYLGISNLKK